MKRIFLLSLLISLLIAGSFFPSAGQALLERKPDSSVYYHFINYPEVIRIYYVQERYSNEMLKQEGWVVRYKNAAESSIFRVKDAPPEEEFEFKVGPWKGYHRNGALSYLDTAFISADSAGNVISYYDKKGVLTERYFHYSHKEVDFKNTDTPPFKAPLLISTP